MPLISQDCTLLILKSRPSITCSTFGADSTNFRRLCPLANLAITTPSKDSSRCHLVPNCDEFRTSTKKTSIRTCGSSVDFGRRSFLRHGTGSCTCGLVDGGDGAAEEEEAVQLKIAVGPIRRCSEKTFAFKRILGPSSVLVVVTLPKPMGIIFESRSLKGKVKECVVVAKLVPGSHAERAARVSQMFQGGNMRPGTNVIVGGDVKPGDILRATTTVGVIVDFFGIRRPWREMWLYKVDGRPWNEIMGALGASFVADGPLTIVLERKIQNVLEMSQASDSRPAGL